MEQANGQVSIRLTVAELNLLTSHLDGLIYSLGFDQDSDLIKLHDKLVKLYNEAQSGEWLQ